MNPWTNEPAIARGKSSSRWRVVLTTVAAVLTGTTLPGQDPLVTFHRLGDLPDGEVWTVMRGISADGSTVVGESWDASDIRPVRWTAAGGLETLGSLPSGLVGGSAFAASADGSVIVGQGASDTLPSGEVFRWTAAGGLTSLGAPAGTDGASASAISHDGASVAGSYSVAFSPRAFRWSDADGFVPINTTAGPGAMSMSLAISGDGSTIAGFSYDPAVSTVSQATVWSGGAPLVLGAFIANGNSEARGLSLDGSVVVGWAQSASGFEAFRWTAGTGLTNLGLLPNGIPFSFANAVSADGSVIVGSAAGAIGTEAFMWTAETGMVAISELLTANGIDLQGWLLTEAVGVSADGLVIVGNGEDADGNRVAWVADLRDPNEPSTDPDDGGGDNGETGEDDPDQPPVPPEHCHGGRPHGDHGAASHGHGGRSHAPHHGWQARGEGFKKLVACVDAKRRRKGCAPGRGRAVARRGR